MEAIERELWRRVRQDQDQDARDFLFLKYSPWARSVAGAVARRTGLRMMEWADHVQNAQLAMLEAMLRFDIDHGIDFIAYAHTRVRGAVFNGMRCYLRADASDSRERISLERIQSLQDDDEDPLDAFVSAVVGLGLGLMLDAEVVSSDVVNDDPAAHGPLLMDALIYVESRRRQILIDHYLRQVSFQEIAAAHGLTKGRISQLHKEGLGQLRAVLRERRYDRDAFF